MTPRIGSVCSGYRGLDAAVEAVFGGTTAWVSDIDPGANRILAHHWPDVPNHGDLTTTDWSAVEPVDIFCGGYPCQPFSAAGLRKGTADARHIWPDIARALRVLRPQLAIFENVANHLRIGFDQVLRDLAALGFDAEWCTVRASEVGAPHQRNRLFILARNADAPGPGLEGPWVPGRLAEHGSSAADAPSLGHHRGVPAWERGPGPADHRDAAAHADRDALRQQPVAEPRRRSAAVAQLSGPDAAADAGGGGRPGHGELPAGRDALRRGVRADAPRCGAASTADEPVCPTCGCVESFHDDGGFCAGCPGCTDPELGRPAGPAANTACLGHGHPRAASVGGIPAAAVTSRAASVPDTDRVGRGQDQPNVWAGQPDADWGRFAPAIARWEHATGRRAPWATDDRNRLSPAFVEWLMGLPAGHVTNVPDLTRNQQLHALGNGVVRQQAEAALRLLLARAEMTRAAA